MIRVHEIKINVLFPVDYCRAAEKALRLPQGSILEVRVVRQSVDAREKPVIYRVFSFDIVKSTLPDEYIADGARRGHFKYQKSEDIDENRCFLKPAYGVNSFNPRYRPVIAGFGPCGMFAALALARCGLKPLILERGSAMEQRIKDVAEYWTGGDLKENSNVQFGEGGAGTFSDGKLTTGIKDKFRFYVLESFVKAGADQDILYKAKPHIGTDVLRTVVVNIRREIESLGGDFCFNTCLTDIQCSCEPNAPVKLITSRPDLRLETDALVLALGHSARDSFAMLKKRAFLLEQKPFSIGLRIEHTQGLIDLAQYGATHEELGIEPAEYKMNCRGIEGRGVYTFCMCPGGEVVNSSSEKGGIVTNGMSNRSRNGKFANSALLCDVRITDFDDPDDPLAGVRFQEKYEKLAFAAGGGRIPKERLKDFTGNSSVLSACLPEFASSSLRAAIPVLGKRLKGFDSPDAMLYGVESRSSSPVRIKRNENGLALSADGAAIAGVYPGGEGAGYAGGIMSSACDGLHIAEHIIENLRAELKA